MTDPRPSENTDDIPQWPGFRAAGFFDDLPNGDDFFTEHTARLGYDTADAQHIVAALDRLTDQLRVSNLLAFEDITGEKNRAEVRKGLGL